MDIKEMEDFANNLQRLIAENKVLKDTLEDYKARLFNNALNSENCKIEYSKWEFNIADLDLDINKISFGFGTGISIYYNSTLITSIEQLMELKNQ